MIDAPPHGPLRFQVRATARNRRRLRRALWAVEAALAAALLLDALFAATGLDFHCTPAALIVCVPLGVGLRFGLTETEYWHLRTSEELAARDGIPLFVRPQPGIRIVLPWRIARALFKPLQPANRWSRNFERIVFWRSTAGLLTVILATTPYEPGMQPLQAAVDKTQLTALLALCASPPLLALLVFITHGQDRRRLRPGLTSMLRRLLLGGLTAAVPLVVIVGANALPDLPSGKEVLDGPWMAAAQAAGWWLPVYAFCTAYWAARTAFWTSDAHPLLAPVFSAALAVTTTGLDLQERLSGPTPSTPALTWYALNLSGLVTTLVLVIVEYRRLRGTGIGWRTGPTPVEADTVPIPPDECATEQVPRCDGAPLAADLGTPIRDPTAGIPPQQRPDGQENP